VLLKVMPLLLISPLAIDVLLAVGTISAVGGALVAISQVDLKRACSYSTTSYLGLVFIAIALQQPFIALLLLFSHALAKAVLFMSVGSIIATTNCQDLTELGGLGSRMPATTTGFLVGAAGLTGLLPLGCFWSFGLMVEGLSSRAPFFAAVVLLTNGLTALNFTRVYRQVFLGGPHPKTRRTPEVNWLMALPMVTVAVLVLVTPLVMARIDRVPGIGAFSNATALLLVGSGLAGLLAGSLVPLDTFWSRSVRQPLRVLQDLLAFDFYTERIYRSTIVAFVASLASFVNSLDRVLVNGLVNRIGSASLASAEGLKFGVSGQLQSYVLTVVVAIVALLTGLVWLKG
jgi:NAD(P)H-quinone oxidoreductase subunit 5